MDSSTNEPRGSLRHFSQCGCSHWAQTSSTTSDGAVWRGCGATKEDMMTVVKVVEVEKEKEATPT